MVSEQPQSMKWTFAALVRYEWLHSWLKGKFTDITCLSLFSFLKADQLSEVMLFYEAEKCEILTKMTRSKDTSLSDRCHLCVRLAAQQDTWSPNWNELHSDVL